MTSSTRSQIKSAATSLPSFALSTLVSSSTSTLLLCLLCSAFLLPATTSAISRARLWNSWAFEASGSAPTTVRRASVNSAALILGLHSRQEEKFQEQQQGRYLKTLTQQTCCPTCQYPATQFDSQSRSSRTTLPGSPAARRH